MAFYKQADLRNREAMTEFLSDHFRYNTMNSWNNASSYAHNMKIHNLPLSKEEKNKLYELTECEGAYETIYGLIADFNREHNYEYQAGFNGRSGGYLVLYAGGMRPSGYKSYCTKCYQQNYKTVEESGAKCGRCGENARRNYTQARMEVYRCPGRSIDQGEDYSDWDMGQLRDRAKLVQEFDKLADAIAAEAKRLANEYEAGEAIIMVPKKVKVLIAIP